MKPEHELRVLEIDPDTIRQRIVKLGGSCEQERILQKRYTYDAIPVNRSKWLRLRTNGRISTLTLKHVQSHQISGTQELEVTVSNFELAAELLVALGLTPRSYHENYRTIYKLKGADIMVDEWPHIPPYLEIESSSPELVITALKGLGFKPEDASSLDVSSIFEQKYKIDIDNMPEFRFVT
jgi:adenylate cyclase class 2